MHQPAQQQTPTAHEPPAPSLRQPQRTPVSMKRKAEKSHEVDEEISKISKQTENFENDEAAIFGRSIATKLRNFDPYTFALARKNIEVMLFDLQYGQTPCSCRSRLGSSVGSQPGYSSGSQPHNSAGCSTGQPCSRS